MVRQKSIAILLVCLLLASALATLTTAVPASRGTPDNADSEPNDTYATATNITSGAVLIPGTLNGADSTDMYKIWLTNSGGNADTITVSPSFNTSNGVSIEITDTGGFQYYKASGNQAQNPTIKVVCGYSEIFYINLSKQGTDASYSLSVTKANGAYQGNANDYPTQAVVSTGDNSPLTNTLEQTTPKDLQDFYKVTVTSSGSAGDVLMVLLKQPATADYWLQLYTPGSGVTYTFLKGSKGSQPGDSMTLSYGALASGDLYLRVFASSGSGAYTLYIHKVSIKKDTSNDYSSATVITLTGQHRWTVQGEVGENVDTEDWYSLPVVKGQYLNASMDSLDYNLNSTLPMINVSLIRADHTSEYSDTNKTASQADPLGYTNGTTPDLSGTNYLQVHALGGGGRYNLSLLTDRPPILQNGLPDSIQVTENSYNDSLNLHNVFSDPDISDVLAFSYEKGDGSAGYKDNTNLSVAIGADGKLNLTPKAGLPRGWTGSGALTLKASDPYGLDASITFTINVKATNHPPYVLAPYNATMSITPSVLLVYGEVERNTTLDLRSVFADNDTSDTFNFDINAGNPLWVNKTTNNVLGKTVLSAVTVNDTVRISFTFEADLVTHQGPIVISLTDPAKATKLNHDVLVYFTAIDNGVPPRTSAAVKLLIQVRKPIGTAPQWKSTFTQVQFPEENTTTINLDDYIIDPDSADQGAIKYNISNYGHNIMVTQKDRSHFTFSAIPNYYGTVLGVKIKATDTFNLTANTTLSILVTFVPDAPKEDATKTSPPTTSSVVLDEGKSVNLTVGVTDPDSLPAELTYEWALDNTTVPTAVTWTYQYSPDYNAAGHHTLTVKVIDDVVSSYYFTVTWNLTVNNVNRLPTGLKILSPTDNQTFKEGAKIAFTAQPATDPDNDKLTYTWYADGQALPGGTGLSFNYAKLKVGTHVIKVIASDGKLSIQSQVTLKVQKKTTKGFLPGFEGPMLFVTLVAVALVLLRKRR